MNTHGFLIDVVEARRLWGLRSTWQRKDGECKGDKVFKALAWSAAHEGMLSGRGPGGEWNDIKQAAFDAATLEYERRSVLTLGM